MDLGTVDTPFTRWLRVKIGGLKLKEVERRSRRAGHLISSSSLSAYLNDGVIPTRPLIRRMAAFWGVAPQEIADLLPGSFDTAPSRPLGRPAGAGAVALIDEAMLLLAAAKSELEAAGILADLNVARPPNGP